MGEITYQGESPFRVMPARGATARVSGRAVEMTVFASVVGKGPTAAQIQVPMTLDEARQLAAELTAAAIDAQSRIGP
jgi:hypothetical protein